MLARVLVLLLLAGCTAVREDPPAVVETPPAASTPDRCAAPGACYGPPRKVGSFDAEVVPEASGLAASVRNPGLYYLLDDGTGAEKVWILDPEAGLLGLLRVAGLDTRDAEAMAVGPCGPGDPATCAYVGDIGDNGRRRDSVRVWRFVEPDLSGGVPPGETGADAISLTYPDEPWNAEAMLVDAAGVPHLLTKAPFDEQAGIAGPARLYSAQAWGDGSLALLGELTPPPPGTPLAAQVVGNVVTAADRHGDRVLIRTYDALVEYVAPAPGAPLAGLPSWPSAQIPGPLLLQAEAVAYTADGSGFLTVSEGVGDVWAVGR